MIKILYNDHYNGGFAFSPAFVEEFRRRNPTATTDITNQWGLLSGPDSLRCNPAVIALVEEKGAEWSSGENCSIVIKEIPAIFAHYWDIDDSTGIEHVRTLVSEAMHDILETYMDSTKTPEDLRVLEEQYAAIKSTQPTLYGTI